MKPIFFLLIFVFFLKAKSQEINEYFADNIKTVLIQNIENELLDPIINLNSNEQLLLSFDEIGTNLSNYKYSFIHCNSKWEKSDLIESDYLDGFYENYIEEYFFSFNTTVELIDFFNDLLFSALAPTHHPSKIITSGL